MRYVILTIICLGLYAVVGLGFLSSLAIALWIWFLQELFENSNDSIAFKEFILTLYGMNYLFSPAFSYLNDVSSVYRMKIPEEDYFLLAIPSMLLLRAGMNLIKTPIFQFHFRTVQLQSVLNQNVLVTWLYAGTVIRFFNSYIPGDLSFFFYLLSSVRFVAAYGLFVMDARRYKWHLVAILFLELLMALQQGMFHDFAMWLIFFGIFWVYIKKPSRNLKLALGVGAAFLFFMIQVAKSEFRSSLGTNQEASGLALFQNAVEKNMQSEEGLFSSANTQGSMTRANQAWIFASTVNYMDHFGDRQGVALLGEYAKAAFLPRFVAPDKMKAGDKTIFNRFSGHRVNSGTSMGLGFFADGYIAYGPMGTYAFAFLLGLIFAGVFKLVEGWSRISPFFILLMFPILHYAVRPDCETQTVMGHIVKGIFVFGCLMWYYSVYFAKVVDQIAKDQALTDVWKRRLAAAQKRKTGVQ
ncbi:hypothetical protein HRH25_09920 [Flavisolibacter sp. BT320]|nr:hypothetical protein [Flavisolibacter longurius]